MAGTPSSPEVLRALWADYVARYTAKVGLQPTRRSICQQIDLDPNALAKWMTIGTPNHKRIPVERINKLAEALMLSERQTNRLMAARIQELREFDPSFESALSWVATKTAARYRHMLNDDEMHVVAAYRVALDSWPRGLYRDGEEDSSLVAMMQVILERAEALHADEHEAELAQSMDLTQTKTDVLAMLRARYPEVFGKKAPFNEALKRARTMRSKKAEPASE